MRAVWGFWLGVVLLGGAVSLSGQNAPTGPVVTPKEEIEIDSLRFRVMAFGDAFFEGIRFENVSEETELLTFNPYRRSKAYEHPKKERMLVFFEEVEDERGRMSRRDLARIDVSKLGDRALLVFTDLPDRENELQYSVLVVDESEMVFGPGAIRFLNLTGAQLVSLVGEERILLGGGFSEVVQRDAADRVPIMFRFAVEVGGEWKSVFATRRQSHEETGTLFILKPPVERDSLKIRVNALVESLK